MTGLHPDAVALLISNEAGMLKASSVIEAFLASSAKFVRSDDQLDYHTLLRLNPILT